jgi:hypothetical protein
MRTLLHARTTLDSSQSLVNRLQHELSRVVSFSLDIDNASLSVRTPLISNHSMVDKTYIISLLGCANLIELVSFEHVLYLFGRRRSSFFMH